MPSPTDASKNSPLPSPPPRPATTPRTPDKDEIRRAAIAAGFDVVRFTHAGLPAGTKEDLGAFLAQGLHGEMDWMSAKAERRGDPRSLWPGARSVIVLGLNYAPASDPRALLDHRDRGVISAYARNRDYHDILKKRLKRVATWLAEHSGAEVKVFVDTAPVMEKPLAQAAGAGWQGKHTNLVSRDFGSWLFLGEIFTALEIEPDAGMDDHCGACRACLDVCPTGAFIDARRIDARRCVSYLTIEHKGHIPVELRARMGNRIYGCDDCLAVCPWNKFARPTRTAELLPRAELTAPRLADLAALDDADFRALFAGSPVKRIGRDRFVRNVLVAIGNSADAALAASARRLLDDASPLVRAAAIWALRRLDPAQFAAERVRRGVGEADDQVRAEWA